jgi:hypothetical protein
MRTAMRAVMLVVALVGCQYGDMPLPDSREHTYGPNEPARSPDLNAMQDMTVGAKHGYVWRWASPIDALWTAGVSDAVRGVGTGLTATATSSFVKVLDLVEGSQIAALQIRYRGATQGNDTLTVALTETQGDAINSTDGPAEIVSIDDGDSTVHTSAVVTFAAPWTVDAAKAYHLEIAIRAGQQLFAIGYYIHNP